VTRGPSKLLLFTGHGVCRLVRSDVFTSNLQSIFVFVPSTGYAGNSVPNRFISTQQQYF